MRSFTIAIGFAFAFVAMFAMAPARADVLKADGKCWDTKADKFGWTACKPEPHKGKAHAKGMAHAKGKAHHKA